MDTSLFVNEQSGHLVPIHGSDPTEGEWHHYAFVAQPLGREAPELSREAYMAVAAARAAIAALDNTSRRLPNPTLLRQPTLRREAQATSALEGTYAPLEDVLITDEDDVADVDLREVLNYVRMADHAFASLADGRPLSVSLLEELQTILVRGTRAEGPYSGRIRPIQVAIGRRSDAAPGDARVKAARFVPPPPGETLESGIRDLATWIRADHSAEIDPVVVVAMAHYMFEALHPFNDGNGRIGRLLVVLQLQTIGLLDEPTLTISPWFEARRTEYYDRLFAVSTTGDWDGFVTFFAHGLRESADFTLRQMLDLVAVRDELKEVVRASPLRAESALLMVDFAVASTSFTIKQAAEGLGLSVARTSKLVTSLVELEVLRQAGTSTYKRRFYAPRVFGVLLRAE